MTLNHLKYNNFFRISEPDNMKIVDELLELIPVGVGSTQHVLKSRITIEDLWGKLLTDYSKRSVYL